MQSHLCSARQLSHRCWSPNHTEPDLDRELWPYCPLEPMQTFLEAAMVQVGIGSSCCRSMLLPWMVLLIVMVRLQEYHKIS
jgi:hypothetical protein